MKVFFVVDNPSPIKEKIEIIKSIFDAELIVLFQKNFERLHLGAYYLQGVLTKNISNVNSFLDYYFKENLIDDIIIVYSSCQFDKLLLLNLKTEIDAGNDIVYLKNKNRISRLYNLFVKKTIGLEDMGGSKKLQYISKSIVEELVLLGFKYRILKAEAKLAVITNYKTKKEKNSFKIKSYNLWALMSLFILTMVCALTFNFIDGTYILILVFICLYVICIFVNVILILKNILDERLR